MLRRVRPLPLAVAGIAIVAALLRLLFLRYPATLDEGGFYLVGQSWLHGGGNLYGQYWVDRPPGLIALFALAASTGHFVVVRVIALVATVVLIVAVARAVHVLGGSAVWAAAVAAGLVLTPLFGAEFAPGELLACSVVAVTFLAAVEARRTTGRRALALAAAAGLLGVAAASVKQNFVDGLIVVGVLLAGDWVARRRQVDAADHAQALSQSRDLVLAWVGGVLLGGLLLLAWCVASTTGPGAVFNAIVTFRFHASSVINSAPGARLEHRVVWMAKLTLRSALLPMLIVLAVVAVRRVRSPSVPGVAVLVGLGVTLIGIVGGGGAWSHYLIGPTVWTAVGAGLAGRWIVTKIAAAAVVLSCLAAIVSAAHAGPTGHEERARGAGLAVHDASQPGDTAVTLYGVANIQLYSGLQSPYPYLWSLPMRVRDPRLHQLISVVSGPSAPTWIVQTNGVNFKGGQRAVLGSVVAGRYREVAKACGSRLWLLDGQDRQLPTHFTCRKA